MARGRRYNGERGCTVGGGGKKRKIDGIRKVIK